MFNSATPPVPPMPDKTQGTYAETRAEIEARKRAELAAQQAMLAAQQAAQAKRSPWLAILTAVFATIALAAAGFAVYEHTELEKLKAELSTANNSYLTAKSAIEELEEDNAYLRVQLKELQKQLTAEEPSPDNTTALPSEDAEIIIEQ